MAASGPPEGSPARPVDEDFFQTIVNVGWGGKAIEVQPAAYIEEVVSTIPQNRRAMSFSTWFRYPVETASGSYTLIQFGGDFPDSSPSSIRTAVSNNRISDIFCQAKGPTYFVPDRVDPTLPMVGPLQQSLVANTAGGHVNVNFTSPAVVPTWTLGGWHHLFISLDVGSADTDGDRGWGLATALGDGDLRRMYIYIDGVSAAYYWVHPFGEVTILGGNFVNFETYAAARGIVVSGMPMGVPMTREWDGFIGNTVVELCDMQIWFNRFIDPTSSSNLQKFVREQKRIPTTVAEAAFGPPTVLLAKGGATGGIINKGTDGTFTKLLGGPFTAPGAIVNYPPPPIWRP